MRRDERRSADDVAQPLAEFAQLRAVLDLDEDGPERRSDRARDGGLCHSKREQSAFPDIGGRGVEHGKIAGDAAHRQMRRKGDGPVLLGKPVDQFLQPLFLAAFRPQPD